MSKTEFWDRIATVNAGMLAPEGSDRWVPMSHHADPAGNRLWFITAKGTDIVDHLEAGPTACAYVLADNAKGLFAQVTGKLALSDDRAKLEELWGVIVETWFEGGIDDPAVRLMSMEVTGGEVWLTPTSGIRFMFNIAKARITGDDPDMGEHFSL